MIVTASGRPVEVRLLCGCRAALTGFKEMALELPLGAGLYADKAYPDYTKAYPDYTSEDQFLEEDKQIPRLALRKGNATRAQETRGKPFPVGVLVRQFHACAGDASGSCA